eukprot:NODE_1016_length_1757_cov_176.066745_g897_i0.p1 GENE.NODE_1016_length_1757_cov_176.066745_g897_i0~~NODE_1016_length_1757_cov_176.066745_g897_i0.p1  ORF type:complete len:430 (+),score=67.55 NODE_1016_length_1757_cov_176.066745_g897_i0:52-1290(+)
MSGATWPALVTVEASIMFDKFDCPEMAEQFQCSVCLGVPVCPRIVQPCEHIFCRSCIEKCLEAKAECPNCRQAIAAATGCEELGRALRQLWGKLRFPCEFCTTSINCDDRAMHLDRCTEIPVQCPHAGCREAPPRKNLEQHVAECVHRLTLCICNYKLPMCLLALHRRRCCPLVMHRCRCGSVVFRSEIIYHRATCPFSEVACPVRGCPHKRARRQIDEHLREDVVKHTLLMAKRISSLEDENRSLLQVIQDCMSETKEFRKMASGRCARLFVGGVSVLVNVGHPSPTIHSAPFVLSGYTFTLLYNWNGNQDAREGWASVHLKSAVKPQFSISISIGEESGIVECPSEDDEPVSDDELVFGWAEFISHESLLSFTEHDAVAVIAEIVSDDDDDDDDDEGDGGEGDENGEDHR